MANTNYSQLANRIAALEARVAELERNAKIPVDRFGSMPYCRIAPAPVGCQCPVGAEKRCNNPMCGRSGSRQW